MARVIEARFQEAVREAVADHHRAGNPVAIWRDGQIVMLHPDGSIQPIEEDEPSRQEDSSNEA